MNVTILNPNAVYSYHVHAKPMLRNVVLLTGVNRSGTTLIGNITGSLQNVEYAFEPWIFHSLPMLVASRQMTSSAAEQLLNTYCGEYYLESLLGRNINVRPSDDTNIWKRKSEEEIHWRFTHLKDRWDAKKCTHECDHILAIKAANYGPFLGQFLAVFPHAKIIHIVRHPFSVAASIVKKGWVDLKQLQDLEGLPIKKKMVTSRGELFLPWWLQEEDAEEFLQMSEMSRALYGWCYIITKTEERCKSLGLHAQHPQYLEIRFEDLLGDPTFCTDRISHFMNAAITGPTRELIRNVRKDPLLKIQDVDPDQLREKDRQKITEWMERHGYTHEAKRT